MKKMYIVFTEIINGSQVERWYYGTYEHDRANEVAINLGQDYEAGVYHCVISYEDAKRFNIKNMPE